MAIAKRPNLLVFFTDQQRHDTTGVHGCPLDLTPNFDRFARAGTDVHYAFTPNPVCGPARACLQTGTYSSTNGTVRNGIALNKDVPHLAALLADHGYHTAYFGKWHLVGHQVEGPVQPQDRGGYQHWLASNLLEMTSDAYRTRLWDNDGRAVDLPGYRVDALADATIRHLHERVRDHPDQPFMVTTSFLEPHHQNHVDDYPAPDGYRERYAGRWVPPDLAALPSFAESGRYNASPSATLNGTTHAHLGGYFGMVKRLDEAFGRITDALRSLDALEDTVIVFLSDHGCHFKTRNGEYKRSGHDASIRVPMMLHGGPFSGGGRLSQMVSLVDIAPTLLDTAGIAVPDAMAGRSLLPLVRRDSAAIADWPEEAYAQVAEMCWGRAVRTKRWKYIVRADAEDGDESNDGVFDRYREAELYDLRHDPYELTNLIAHASHDQVREVMRGRLRRWLSRLNEPDARIDEPETKVAAGQRWVSDAEALT
ncbi:MAG: sulfatase-like hydrolase/transferase [Planctomycetota bacterium]